MNHTRLIQYSFALLFIIISVSSFSLSYLNLMSAAIDAGIIPALAWLWPLTIDAFLIMGSLFILQSSLQDEKPAEGWIVVSVFTVISIGFNIAHSPADWLSRAAHAIPPIALCWSLHMLMVRLKRDLMKPDTADEIIAPASPEKIEKVRSWFTDNPDSSISQARQALKMGYSTVSACREYLVSTGQLSSFTE